MSVATKLLVRTAISNDFSFIVELLKNASLPTVDINPSLSHFFVAELNNVIIGVIGLEIYNENALLRSMVVSPEYRNRSVATMLLTALTNYAAEKRVEKLFLITTSAEGYFSRKGFCTVSREDVPLSILSCPEFTTLCPSTATVMKKDI